MQIYHNRFFGSKIDSNDLRLQLLSFDSDQIGKGELRIFQKDGFAIADGPSFIRPGKARTIQTGGGLVLDAGYGRTQSMALRTPCRGNRRARRSMPRQTGERHMLISKHPRISNVIQISSNAPGPKIVLFSGIHGDEVSGIHALEKLFFDIFVGARGLKRGTLTLAREPSRSR